MAIRLDEESARSKAQTLDRGLQVLEAIADARRPLSIAEIGTTVGLHRTVVYRLIRTLAGRGYLQPDAAGNFRLGATCVALASAVTDLRSVSRPILEELARCTGETVHIAVLSGNQVVWIDGIESAKALRVTSRVGRKMAAHATAVGKSWLATLDEGRLHQLYPDENLPQITPQTIGTRTALKQALHAVRRDGSAINRGESEHGLGSVGAVVCNATGEPRAALSVAMPLERFSAGAQQAATAALLDAAGRLSTVLSQDGGADLARLRR